MSAAQDTSQRALTERQRRFAEHYAASGNGAESARVAGYAKKIARISAQEVLSNPNVVALVDELRKEHLQKLGVRPERVLEELAASAFLDPKTCFDEDGNLLPVHRMPKNTRRAIKRIRVRKSFDKKTGEQIGEDVDVEFNCKLRSNEILGRHLGVLKETPIQVNQQNVFAAIVERAQGSALLPATQRDDDDANDDERIIEGEIVERESAPAQPMASGSTLTDFSQLDDDDDEAEGDAQSVVVDMTPIAVEQPEDASISKPTDRDIAPLWKRRRRNV